MFAKIKNFIIKLSHLNHSNSLKNFLALCLGVLLDLAFAPFNCFLFAIISLSAFFLIIDKLSDLKQVFVRSFFYCFGFAHYSLPRLKYVRTRSSVSIICSGMSLTVLYGHASRHMFTVIFSMFFNKPF